MSAPVLKTTAPPRSQTTDARVELPIFWLVIVQCEDEPWRICQCSPFPLGQRKRLGRGGEKMEEYATFDAHRPGDPFPPNIGIAGCFGGDKFSRMQAFVTATAVDLLVENRGRAKMLINGEEVPSTLVDGKEVQRGNVRPGDRLAFVGAGTFLCVLRPPAFPALLYARMDYRFGDPDQVGNVGESPETWRVLDEAARIGKGVDYVLIFGETGVGKTGIARLIHLYSSRAAGPFIRRNCEKLTIEIIEPELFGKIPNYPNPGPGIPGLLPSAHGGTLFLDEIARLISKGQGILLTVLEDGEYERLGEMIMRILNVRFIGATNLTRDALQSDFHHRFKADIYLSPLRERREDIVLLLRELLLRRMKVDKTLIRFFEKSPDGGLYPRVSGTFVEFLMRHELPGNTRELDLLLAAAIPAPDSGINRIELVPRKGPPAGSVRPSAPPPSELLPPALAPASGTPSSGAGVASSGPVSGVKSTPKGSATVTKDAIAAALEAARGNVSEAARRLGMNRTTLIRRMAELGMTEPKE